MSVPNAPAGCLEAACQVCIAACLARHTNISELARYLRRSDAVPLAERGGADEQVLSSLDNIPAEVVMTELSACLRGCVRPQPS